MGVTLICSDEIVDTDSDSALMLGAVDGDVSSKKDEWLIYNQQTGERRRSSLICRGAAFLLKGHNTTNWIQCLFVVGVFIPLLLERVTFFVEWVRLKGINYKLIFQHHCSCVHIVRYFSSWWSVDLHRCNKLQLHCMSEAFLWWFEVEISLDFLCNYSFYGSNY